MISLRVSSQSVFALLLAMVIFGYPISALLSTVFQINTEIFTYFFRIATFGLGIMALLMPGAKIRISSMRLLLLFLGVYLFRLVYDSSVANIPGAMDALIIFLVMTLLPALGFWSLGCLDLDFDTVSRYLIVFSLFFLILFYIAYFSGRYQVNFIDIDIGRLNFNKLGPIALGHAAVSCILIGVVSCKSGKKIWNIWSVLLILASIPILLSVGSRGPILALLISSMIFLRNFKPSTNILGISVVLLILYFAYEQSTTISRVTSLFDSQQELDLSALARLEYQGLAIQSFLDSPLIGQFYIDSSLGEGKYPHNILIEAGMALGLLGFIPLTIIIGRVLKIFIRPQQQMPIIFVVLAVQYLVNSMLSANLWGGSDKFWLLAGITILIADRINSHKRNLLSS